MSRSLRPLAAIAIATVLPCAIAAPAAAGWNQNGVPLCTEAHDQYPTSIISDGTGGAIVFWEDDRFGSSDIFAQRIDGTGAVQWSADGVPVCTQSSQQTSPAAVAASAGGSVVVWSDHRGSTYDLYAQRLDANGTPLWDTNGVLVANSSYDDEFPSIISDQHDSSRPGPGWIIAWHTRTLSYEGYRVQHIAVGGTVQWGSDGLELSNTEGNSGGPPVMVTDGPGGIPTSTARGAIIAWSRYTNGPTSADIFAAHVDGTGASQWPYSFTVCGATGAQITPAIASVGTGTTITAWDDMRSVDHDIWAQKLDLTGAPQWLGDGLPVCRATGAQTNPKLVASQGGAIVAWEDTRNGTPQIYAQRLDTNGQPMWALDGVPLSPTPTSELDPSLIADGNGGAIVAWGDDRTGDFNIYAQHVDVNGNLTWTAGGVALTRAANNQSSVMLVGDAASGAIAAWSDLRDGDGDVYANRITSTGGVVDVAVAMPSRLRLAFASANPTRGDVRLRLELPAAAGVTAEVVDVAGRRVRALASGARLDAGVHALTWDGADDAGGRAMAGVFFVNVRAGDATLTTRVVRLR